jgi:periplasmic protein CpxP/Spy
LHSDGANFFPCCHVGGIERNSTMIKSRFSAPLKAATLAACMAVAGASFAQTTTTPPGPGAQPGAQAPHAHRGMERGQRGDASRFEARMQRRLGELKQQLKIEPAQEAAWTAWTTAMKPPSDVRQVAQQMHADMDKLSTPERIDRMKTMRAMRDAQMDKRAQATKDFYAQLTPEQKKTFDSQRPMGEGPGMGHGGGHGKGRDGGHGGGRHGGHGMMGGMHGQADGQHQPGQGQGRAHQHS